MKRKKVKALENKLKSKVAELTNAALRDIAEKLNVTPGAEAGLIFEYVLNEMSTRMAEKDFCAFCAELRAVA